MKAVMYTQYGNPDVLTLQHVEKPTPKPDEILVKVHAVSINAGDHLLREGSSALVRLMAGGLNKPRPIIPCGDVAGTVTQIGASVTDFKVGDAVYTDVSNAGFGGLAEYIAVPQHLATLKPANLSFEEAATIPVAATTALQGLRDIGRIQAGQTVLINGTSGGVGTFALQIAKSYGAHVTAVCSTSKMEMARTLGADRIIDYTRQDFAKTGEQYDLVAAVNGFRSLGEYRRLLKPNGRYVMIGGSMKQIFQTVLFGGLLSLGNSRKMGNVMAKSSQADLIALRQLAEAGKIKPVIDRCYNFDEFAEAFRHFAQGHTRGKIVITVAQS